MARHRPSDPARTGSRWSRRLRLILGLATLAVVLAFILRAPSATSQFVSAFRHFRPGRLPWVAVAAGLETASLASSALVQRRLLDAGHFSVPFPSLLGLVVASTAMVDLLPAGLVPSNGWLVEQYHWRGAPVPLGLWTVTAAGFVATVSELGLLLVGVGVADVWSPIGAALCGAALVIGSFAFVVGAHRLASRSTPLTQHFHRPVLRLVAQTVERAAAYRIPLVGGTTVFVYSALNWLLDAGCLVLAFVLLGLPVPWRGLLFAYAASQTLGGMTLLRIGTVEAGLVGGLVVTGTKAPTALAAALMYRAFAYWVVASVGGVIFIVFSRRQKRQAVQRLAAPGGDSKSQ
jgi:putative heme transporter